MNFRLISRRKLNKLIEYLPIVRPCDDDPVAQVELAVVDGRGRAIDEVCVAKDGLHALELLAVGVEQFVFNLVEL